MIIILMIQKKKTARRGLMEHDLYLEVTHNHFSRCIGENIVKKYI